jgi:hypothetical protein
VRLALLFMPVCVFRFSFVFCLCFSFFVCFLSPLVWFFLWIPEEVLALLFLLHCENGDFSILMKDIDSLRKLMRYPQYGCRTC